MKTVNDLPHFSSCLDVIGVSTGKEYTNFRMSKNFLLDIFQDMRYDEKLSMLGFLDDLHTNFFTQNFISDPLTNNLCDKFFEINDNKKVDDRIDTTKFIS